MLQHQPLKGKSGWLQGGEPVWLPASSKKGEEGAHLEQQGYCVLICVQILRARDIGGASQPVPFLVHGMQCLRESRDRLVERVLPGGRVQVKRQQPELGRGVQGLVILNSQITPPVSVRTGKEKQPDRRDDRSHPQRQNGRPN